MRRAFFTSLLDRRLELTSGAALGAASVEDPAVEGSTAEGLAARGPVAEGPAVEGTAVEGTAVVTEGFSITLGTTPAAVFLESAAEKEVF